MRTRLLWLSILVFLVVRCTPEPVSKVPQLFKEINVYTQEVKDKHLEKALDTALWYAYASKFYYSYVEITFKNVLDIPHEQVKFLYECPLDASRLKIKRDEANKSTEFGLNFRTMDYWGIHRWQYKDFIWSPRLRFCELAKCIVFDSTNVVEIESSSDCISIKYKEYRVCNHFENRNIVKRMTPWLRREGVRRGYLSTDNW